MVPTAHGPVNRPCNLHVTLRPEPLVEAEEFRQYYRPQVNEVRGEDTTPRESQRSHPGVRLSIATELNPANFKVLDVVLLMLVGLAEEASRTNAIPMLSEHLASDIEQWFGTQQIDEQFGFDSSGAR
jgi:hypothetical protein